MKVLHLISGGDTGGAKTHVLSLLQGLGPRIDVSMVCFTEGPFAQEARELGIRVQVMAGRNILRVVKLLERKVRDEGIELLHCHGSRGNVMGWLLKRRTGLPVVTTVHSDYRLDYLGRPLARMTYGVTNTIVLRMLDYHIGVSDAMVNILIDRGFPPQNVFTIYNGLDFSPRTPPLGRKEYLRSLGLDWPEDCVIAGITARLNPVKDIPTLLRGFSKAHAGHPELRLLIAGDGEEMGRLKRLAAELGVEREVCFTGWISDTDSFYNALDINTLTSLSETFSYSLTEGARFHLPAVASRVGGVPYLIEHGVHGLLFEAGDVDTLSRHLSALAGDRELRRRLGESLYHRARTDYSLEGTLSRQLEIYNAIMRREARKSSGRDGVVVCGAYGRGNAGDDAILEAILSELRQIDPDLPVWVLSRNPKATRRIYRVNTVYMFHVPRFRRCMRRARLYINGGGSLMQDVTSRRSLWFYLYTISAAKRLGCKVMMYGCGIGPVNYPADRRYVGRVVGRNVDVITLRDSHSLQELSDMGITEPEILLSADPTVILSPSPRPAVDSILEKAGLDPAGRYLGISVRPWPGFQQKIGVFAEAADYAYGRYGLTPVFLPVEGRLDLPASAQVAERLTVPHCVIAERGSPALTIGLFARMDVVVSMRLHALVFSAGQGVPLVGVAYDQKVSSFLDMVGQDLYINLEDVTASRLCALIDAAVGRVGNDALLSAGVARLRELEHNNSEMARKLLGAEECT